ncbi:MAG: ABC transporter ATP-binding protein [Longimicrobiales bacterium]|nr:ABC transporter ATP-binding protein [Longimicrobiales bacterium]
MSPTISLSDFGVHFPAFRLGPLDLDLQPGERVALLGANGAGKSTTLRAIGGRLRNFTGSVRVFGEPVERQIPAVRARIGFLAERLLGFGWMTVRQHLGFLQNFFPGWDAAYAEQLRDRLALPEDARVGTLSKGMQVKLSLLAAEAHRPPILLLDEPTSGIDPLMRGEILDLIRACVPEGSERLVIFSSHLLEDVDQVARRVVLLKEGRLVADTPIADLKAREPGAPLSRILMQELKAHG